MKQAIVKEQPEENTRLTLLEDCERKITTHLRRGIEATVGIGQQLIKINEMELYLERGYKTLNEYCFDCHSLDGKTVSRFMGIADSARVLKDHGLELPIYESHVAELAVLEPADRVLVWGRVIQSSEKRDEPVTVDRVREAVEWRKRELKEQAPPPTTRPSGGSKSSLEEPDLDLGSDLSNGESERSSAQPEPPTRITLTEDGERDLERIRRLCGDAVGNSIEYLHLQITEKELHLWAQEDDPDRLTYYIMDLRWSVAKALGVAHESVTERTNVGRLLIFARANGGHFETQMEGSKIIVETLV